VRPWILDLCCGGGGFSAGMHAAGFDVIGVDIEPQPDYPFPFVRADALTVPLDGFAAIIGSPPCQRWSQATPTDRRDGHPDILTPLRERLIASGVPWILENVPGAPMRSPIQLCGTTLRLGVRRHRLFESSVPLVGTPCAHDTSTRPVAVYGTYGGPDGGVSARDAREAMGTPWLPWPALAQSIPPAYGMFLGAQLWRFIASGPWPQPRIDGTVLVGFRHGVDLETGDATPAVERDLSALVGALVCRHCRIRPVSRPLTGRWGRYCSHACRQAAYRAREALAGRIR